MYRLIARAYQPRVHESLAESWPASGIALAKRKLTGRTRPRFASGVSSPAIRSILAHPFYSIRDIPYDKYLGLIFIRAKGPLPSPLRSAENLRSGDRGSDGFRDLWRLYLVIEFVLARLAVVNAAGMALYPDATAVSTVFFVESGFSNRTECCDNIIPLPPIFHFNGLIGPANLQFFAHPRIIQIR